MKKLLYLFILLMYPPIVSALEFTYLGVTFRYEILSGDNIRIIGIDENSSAFSDTNYTNLIFPSHSNNLNIKEIGLTPTGFDVGNLPPRITHITLEDGIEKILDVCFINYTQIEAFSLPESILSMGREAFTSCTSITDFTIPSSVAKIDRRLFENCTNLRHIHIPNSVTRIESDAFNYCIKLQEIELPSNLTTLRSSAFMDCQSLKKVIIPNGITRISIQGGKYDLCYAAYPHRISNFPLNLFAIKNKSYTIELNDTTNSSHISSILLIDHDTNFSTNILKHTYSFIANSTSTSNRFELVINPKDQTTHIIPNKNQESIHSLNNHIFFTNCRGKYIIYNNKGQIMEKGNIKKPIYQSKAMTKGIYIVDHNNKVYKIILL